MNYVADTYNIGIIRNDRVVEVIKESPTTRSYHEIYDAYYQANKEYATNPPGSIGSSIVIALAILLFLFLSAIVTTILIRRNKNIS